MFVEKWNKDSHEFKKQNTRETTYSVGIVNGERLFQIQTYGADGLNSGAKQIIQFDEARALQLIDILKREFHI